MVDAIPVLELLARQRHHTEGRESRVGASAINPKNLSLVPRFHMVEEENHLPKCPLISDACAVWYSCTHQLPHTNNNAEKQTGLVRWFSWVKPLGVKSLSAKSNDLSSDPGTHRLKGEN